LEVTPKMDESIILSSERLHFCVPILSRDAAMHTLFNDRATMLPFLPMLCPMSLAAMEARRKRHRAEVEEEKGLFLDVVLQRTGELIGTTGFRSMDKVAGTAEWGIIISKEWHRKGICTECFEATLSYAAKTHGIHTVTAATLGNNVSMLAFFEKRGMAMSAITLATPVAIAEAAPPKITAVMLQKTVVSAIAKHAKADPTASLLAMLKAGVGVTIDNGVVNPTDPAAAQRAMKAAETARARRPLPTKIAKAPRKLAPPAARSAASPSGSPSAANGSASAGTDLSASLGSITLPTSIADGVASFSMNLAVPNLDSDVHVHNADSLEWLVFEAKIADVLEKVV